MKATLSNPTSQMSIMKSGNNKPTRNIQYGGSGSYSNTNTNNYGVSYLGNKDNSIASQISAQLREQYKRK